MCNDTFFISHVCPCRNVAIIKSSKDTRYALDSIVTHDGDKLPCWPLEALSSFKERIGLEAYHEVTLVSNLSSES